jgi:hypothetical protein
MSSEESTMRFTAGIVCLAFLMFSSVRIGFGDEGAPSFPKISVRDGRIFSGDEELFIKAVGYAGLRPGKDNKDSFQYGEHGYALMEQDMKRIRDAGFNAIRTWGLLDETIIRKAQDSGLWVVGGIWTQQYIVTEKTAEVASTLELVRAQARTYARYPNIAMLLVLNEPDPGTLLGQKPEDNDAYFRRLAAAAREGAPGIPISFSNWSNTAFVDSSPWDVISFNLYAQGMVKFMAAVGYSGYVGGIRHMTAKGKPFFVSEYGFYTPVPRLHNDDAMKFNYVKDEGEQAEKLLRDLDTLTQQPIAGCAALQWLDNWSVSENYSFMKPLLKDPSRNKFIHDMVCVEWAGLNATDDDVRGKPRKAYFEFQKANQALLLSPDSEEVHSGKVSLRLYLEDAVARLSFSIDGREMGAVPRISAHWAATEISVAEICRDPAVPEKHQLVVRAADKDAKIISTVKRAFWTGPRTPLPEVKISHKVDKMGWPTFTVTVAHADGRPVPNAKVNWGMLDAINWQEGGGAVTTDGSGTATFESPLYGPLLLVGAGCDFLQSGYSRKCTAVYYFRN